MIQKKKKKARKTKKNHRIIIIGVHVSFGIMAFSGYMPRAGLAETYVSSTLSFCVFFFKVTFTLFSIVAASI